MTVMIDAEYVLKIIGDQLYGEMSAGDEYLYDHKTYDDGLEWCFELIRNVANNTQETILVKPPHWISVKDRLPKDYVSVLAFGDEGLLIAEHYRFGDWVKFMLDKDGRYMCPYPTTIYYWMPLPEPPKMEKKHE